MTKRNIIDQFLTQRNIAVVGVSRSKKKFGYSVFKVLRERGFNTIPVNPNLDEIDDVKCYHSLKDVPGQVEAAVIVIPPEQTINVVKDAKASNIEFIWMQQGSESEKAINYCKENGIKFVNNECILMFSEPVKSFHKFHRWINKITGKLPA